MAGGSPEERALWTRVALVGLGCRVSQADLDSLALALPQGAVLAERGEAADLVVVGTCTITADADAASRQAVRRAARENPGARIVVAGCYAARSPEVVGALPQVAAVVGARDHGELPAVLASLAGAQSGGAAKDAFGPAPDPSRAADRHHARPVLKVQDGCDQRCTYCAVPLARGPSCSMPLEAAVARGVTLRAHHAELVLTGIHLGAYGRDLRPAHSLAELVRALCRPPGGRLRLSSVEPPELPLELLEEGGEGALCPHFHLPLQSGSDRLLEAMGRPYRKRDFARVVEAVERRIPGVCLGTDVLVGFAGETYADHLETLDLLASLPLRYLHVFPYSPRPGTPAAVLPGLPSPGVRRDRAAELRALSERRWAAYLRSKVGRTLEVVVERVEGLEGRGTSREFVPVRWFSSGAERRGQLSRVRIAASDGQGCLGEAVKVPD